jgi:hypothetical protein
MYAPLKGSVLLEMSVLLSIPSSKLQKLDVVEPDHTIQALYTASGVHFPQKTYDTVHALNFV